ncbi:MAG: aconitase X swivel domain-containing protein [Acidimicrobiales bacterium]
MPEAERVLMAGEARGPMLHLEEPISFWGGLDPWTGIIIDQAHPQVGESIVGRILLLPAGRGSSSGSSVLTEVLRAGIGPAGIVMQHADEILVIGALVAEELYDITVPIFTVDDATYRDLTRADAVVMAPDGTITTG